jgi:hypothetical protein
MPGVVVLGGGSTGEHFCGAMRSINAEAVLLALQELPL